MRPMIAIILCVVAAVLQPALWAQPLSFRTRPGVAAGIAVYNGDADVQGVGALGRVLASVESPGRPFSAEFEGAYHLFTVLLQRCPTCPGCRCSPEAPPPEVWSGRLSVQWHVLGAPGGVYATSGLGLYSPIRAPGAPGRTGMGVDFGLGVRRAGAGLFFEARCLWVRSRDTTAWLFPVAVGYRL